MSRRYFWLWLIYSQADQPGEELFWSHTAPHNTKCRVRVWFPWETLGDDAPVCRWSSQEPPCGLCVL